MEKSLLNYFESIGESKSSEDIVKIALEGQGKILDRVEMHHMQLVSSDKVESLKQSDHVFIISHSQGVPVSVILLDRLMKENILDAKKQKIIILMMAGVNHGPFPYLKANLVVKYFEADASRELFELNDPQSAISLKYKYSLQNILTSDTKLLCVGGWMDQVVPLYSSLMHGTFHPNILRSAYVETSNDSEDFLIAFISFLVKLKNKGHQDDNLLILVSEFLAGSLYNDNGHSTLYEDSAVFNLCINWLLATDSIYKGDLNLVPIHSTKTSNHYFIPWILHKMLTNPVLLGDPEISADISKLANLFPLWRPETKLLRDLKYRLEPITSRL